MNYIIKVLLIYSLVILVAGCPPVQKYRPAPIAPAAMASSLEARSLHDPGLKRFLDQDLGHELAVWPPQAWDLRALTLAAFYFNPALDVARARVAAAQAAIVTAGARPNPTLSITPGIPSPYLLGIELAIPFETAGKRGLRTARARSLSEAARYDLAGAAWLVRSAVRKSLLDCFLAVRALDLLHSEERLRTAQVGLLERRLAVGEIPRPEVDLARIELAKTHLAIKTAEGRIAETRAILAAAIGVPVAALDGINFSWATLDHPPNTELLAPQLIQREAVLNRLDVRRGLEEYAAAEAELQLEVAAQHPDFQIGPGYTYEEMNNFFTLALSKTLPIFNRNQGPIAEAVARRKEAAANFLATQARVIAESESALARYRSALKELDEVEQSLAQLQARREQMARHAVQYGESDRVALNGVLLERAAIATARLGALGRAQSALGDLEDAIQRPLEAGDIAPLTPESPALKVTTKEAN
jgi:outer membrane protein TolC